MGLPTTPLTFVQRYTKSRTYVRFSQYSSHYEPVSRKLEKT